MSQEHLSNLFKELVAGTTVLPIGVVNAEPGAFPGAHAPALLDAESNLCHGEPGLLAKPGFAGQTGLAGGAGFAGQTEFCWPSGVCWPSQVCWPHGPLLAGHGYHHSRIPTSRTLVRIYPLARRLLHITLCTLRSSHGKHTDAGSRNTKR